MATTTGTQPSATADPTGSNNGPLYIDTQHDDMIHDAQLDYYGCKLATSSSDRTVKIYDVSGNSYTHTATLQKHTGPVWSLSWSHPKYGSLLASASFDGSVLIHREMRPREWTLIYGQTPSNEIASSTNLNNLAATGAATNTSTSVTLHESSVNDVSFAPHEFGLILAACSSDGKVSVLTHGAAAEDDNDWLVEYIQDNALGVNAISWAPYMAYDTDTTTTDGNTNSQMRLVTGGCDNKIRFWTKASTTPNGGMTWIEDSANQPISSTSATHSDWIRDVAWSPSIIPDTNIIASCSEDRTVIIWTQKGGLGHEWKGIVLHTFDDPVWKLSWNMTGSILAVSSGDSNVTLWKQDMNEMWTQVSSVDE